MPLSLEIKTFRGKEGAAYIDHVSDLRIRVFREYPYLYDGDKEYEKKYLSRYFSLPSSFLALACMDGSIVGASTAMHLKDELSEFRAPFEKGNFDIENICYFGESVLLPKYRGQGIGKIFMEKRMEFAKNILKATHCCFCAVQREISDPRKPKTYQPLDEFWKKIGFQKMDSLKTSFSWKELDEETESLKTMQFWIKSIAL